MTNIPKIEYVPTTCPYCGVGVNPLRGQNNVQGACDMGAYPNVYSGYQKCEVADNRARMEKAWGITGLPDWYGATLIEQIKQCGEPIKAMYILGLNPVVTYPDSNLVKKQAPASRRRTVPSRAASGA